MSKESSDSEQHNEGSLESGPESTKVLLLMASNRFHAFGTARYEEDVFIEPSHQLGKKGAPR